MLLMLTLLDPPADSSTAISVDPEMVVTPVVPSRGNCIRGGPRLAPRRAKGKALNSFVVVAGKFAGVL